MRPTVPKQEKPLERLKKFWLQFLKKQQKLQDYPNIKTLVAFSGSIQDESGNRYTEKNINNISTESELRVKFDSQEYNILIVVEKYQTGYDQPLLHTMYADKKLYGIKAVQTLSRLNRTSIGKTDTFIVDFQNSIEEIIKAFEPFYQGTTLVDKSDPSYLFRLYDLILKYGVITNNFAETYFKPRSSQFVSDLGKLYSIMNLVLDRFRSITEIQQDGFKQRIKEFIETYSFMAQIVT